jgi:hypothetical protein
MNGGDNGNSEMPLRQRGALHLMPLILGKTDHVIARGLIIHQNLDRARPLLKDFLGPQHRLGAWESDAIERYLRHVLLLFRITRSADQI